jgi:hypothetical protein
MCEEIKIKGEVLTVIKDLWITYPQLRLGQLLINVIPIDKDLYYITDEELIEYLNNYDPLRPMEVS